VLVLAAPGLSGDVLVNVPTLTTVGAAAFSGNLRITSVSIPGVTAVKDHAFAYCEKLTSVTLGALTEIGDYAFFRTKLNLVPSLSKVNEIGAYAFAYSAVTELTLPEGIKVNEGAFKECKSLAKITVGDGVVLGTDVFRLDRVSNFTATPGTYRNEDGLLIYYYIYTSPLHELTLGENVTIGDGAFYGASELKSLTVGAGSTIGAYAFYNATSLEHVKLDGVISIGKAAFSGDVLNEFVDQNMNEPYYLNDVKDYSYRYYSPVFTYVDLSGVSSIGEDCFAFCKKLTTVSLGSSITEIPARAFTRCNALTTVSLYNVTVIGENAFEESALKSVTLPKIETVGKYAFVNCKSLSSVAFGGDAWIAVGEGAFSYCESLATVSGTAKLSDVGAYSFAYTAVTSADLSGAWRIGDAAFLKEKLTDFEVTVGEFLSEIGENPFAYCRLDAFTRTLTEEWGGNTYSTETDTFDLNERVRVIDGMLLTPHLPSFFSDLYLHPNDLGFEIYAQELVARMREIGF
jgi:acetyltransferase-like isoleucine patch superfamily enzyme